MIVRTNLFSKLYGDPTTMFVVPSSFDFSSNIVSSSSHVGSLKDASSVTRLVCWVAVSRIRISDFFECSEKLYVETEYKTFDASEFGTPPERRGASKSTSGVNLAALIVILVLALREAASVRY
jgi:hypothetical protein